MSEDFSDKDFDLTEMSLFIIPVSLRFLSEPNYAKDRDLAFAKRDNIAVLPIVLESGLDSMCSREEYFGDIPCLDPDNHDLTDVSYKKKLKKEESL